MNELAPISSFYKVGGALTQDVSSYVTRASDDELYKALKAGEFCYVLNSRQMGKSSLMVRTLTRLQADAWAGMTIDFSAKDSQSDRSDYWYDGIINKLNGEFKLLKRQEFLVWLKERDFIAPVERLGEFIETVLLPGIESPIVIFIDEIDSTLKLPFTDDFFALIRACYNKRAENPDYQRLTFALFGVAAPSDLVSDAQRTPFNIGKRINLKGFTLSEALILAEGLTAKCDAPKKVLQEILNWTGGQPFLTQHLCQLVVDSSFHITSGSEVTLIKKIVESRVIKHWESQDKQVHLETIVARIIIKDKQKTVRLLEMYKKIIKGGIRADNRNSEQIELILSGLVLCEDQHLKPFNKIYETIFDLKWVEEELAKITPYEEQLNKWSEAKEDQKPCFLLYGKKLKIAREWFDKTLKHKQNHEKYFLLNKHLIFLDESKEFWQKIQLNFPQESNYEIITKAVIEWIGGVKSFDEFIDKFILKKAKRFKKSIEIGQEEKWIETNLIVPLKDNKEARQYFEEISNSFTENKKVNPFLLLSTYKEILEEKIKFDDSSLEQQELINMCIVIKEENQLKILNKIYQFIFDENWVAQQISFICPYTKSYHAWKDSESDKKPYLLKGQDLQNALNWIQNQNQLNELEIEFIFTSLICEIWQPESNVELDKVIIEAVKIIKEFRAKIKTRTKTADALIRETLELTKSNSFLLKEVLQLVTEQDNIIDKNQVQWLRQIVRANIQEWNAEKLFKSLDFNNTSNINIFWKKFKEENENYFKLIDIYIKTKGIEPKKNNKNFDILKNILENYHSHNYNINNYNINKVKIPNLQSIILNNINFILCKAKKTMAQNEFDELLDNIIQKAKGDLEAVIIFDLSEGLPLYHNKGLKEKNPSLYYALFGEEKNEDFGGEAIEDFMTLNKMEEAFNNFGEKTQFGKQESININFVKGKMTIYFYQAPDIPTAICFMASEGINLGSINRMANKYIQEIRKKLDEISED